MCRYNIFNLLYCVFNMCVILYMYLFLPEVKYFFNAISRLKNTIKKVFWNLPRAMQIDYPSSAYGDCHAIHEVK